MPRIIACHSIRRLSDASGRAADSPTGPAHGRIERPVGTRRGLTLLLVAIVAGIPAFGLLDRARLPAPLVRGDSWARPPETAIAAIHPDQLVTVLRRDAIAAIFDRPQLPAAEGQLRSADGVIGVVVAR
jgi:hypothetical protein